MALQGRPLFLTWLSALPAGIGEPWCGGLIILFPGVCTGAFMALVCVLVPHEGAGGACGHYRLYSYAWEALVEERRWKQILKHTNRFSH